MKALVLAITELRRFRGFLPRAAVVAIGLLPLLYGSLYLWSNWDPYGRLDKIPVAVVNSDRPVTVGNETINAGQLFVDQLKHHPLFDWQFTSSARAADGLAGGRYYFTIAVPSDFSAKLASPETGFPQRAGMHITLNDGNGYIAGIVASTAGVELQQQINAAAYTAYADYALGDVAELGENLDKAASSAAQLAAGNAQIATATEELYTVGSQLGSMASSQLPAVASTATQVTTAAQQVTGTVATAATGVSGKAQTALANLTTLGQQHPDIAADPVYQQVLAGAQTIASDASSAASAATSVDGAARQAVSDAATFSADVPALQSRIAGKVEQLGELRDGASEAATGAQQLADGMTTAAAQVPRLDAEQRKKAASIVGNPVSVTKSNLHPADTYGRGLAPFFFGIALWVFALVVFSLLRPLSGRALVSRARALTVTLGGYLPAAGLGLAGAAVLFLVVNYGLGLDPLRYLGTVGVLGLAVLAFVAINQALRVAFGIVGQLISLVLLMLQLTSAGGLYPIETSPLVFRMLHPFLPMSYLVDALRVTISGGDAWHLQRGIAVLAAFALGGLLFVAVLAWRQRVWTMFRLKPPVEI